MHYSRILLLMTAWLILTALAAPRAFAVYGPDSTQQAREYAGFGAEDIRHGNPLKALVSFNRALELNPRLTEAWIGRGRALAQMQHFEEALEASAGALRLEPSNFDAWLLQGETLLVMHRFDAALEAFEQGILLRPASEYLWRQKAEALDSLGRAEEARAAYEHARALQPPADTKPYKGGVTRMTRTSKPAPPPRAEPPETPEEEEPESNR